MDNEENSKEVGMNEVVFYVGCPNGIKNTKQKQPIRRIKIVVYTDSPVKRTSIKDRRTKENTFKKDKNRTKVVYSDYKGTR